ncbi:type II secretion system minor pseudopilin GspK [Vibrio sonorensis]|uniref:type II secretion system minor pseudopilin GspK n=1 Tax=Vibrio sonorensis TaxID=1004316 RepID=UPI0008DA2DB6|nr:type II secretion system minor pseudopilin GspK [Vibrio sonorensis]
MAANKKQNGVALIVILLLIAVMAAIAATMSERLFSQFRRSTNQLDYQQAYWYSVGVESLAKVAIEQSYRDSDTVNMSQPWALEEQTYPLDHGTIRGAISDKQSCLNLNVFHGIEPPSNSNQQPYPLAVFQALMEELEVENYAAEIISQSVWEFVDSNTTVNTVSGVEDSYYESLSPAYVAANTMLADSSELRAVQEVSGEIMSVIDPYICALPTLDWRMNVNTLDEDRAELLSAMFYPDLSSSDAKSILENRPYDGWDSVDSFLAEAALSQITNENKQKVKPYLSVDSRYFELDIEVLVNDARVRVRSLLHSDNRENASVIRRRFGGIGERISDRSSE